MNRYHEPDTSDKRDDESWVAYWDRRRHEMHGPDCACLVCDNEELLKTLGSSLLPADMQSWIED